MVGRVGDSVLIGSLSGVFRLRTPLLALLTALAVVLAAPGTASADLSLNVTFNPGNPPSITVTLPNRTPLGTTSGPPTVIAAGFYTLHMDDTAAVGGPQFDLQGPSVSLVDNMFYGEVGSSTDTANFLPNSTYTWRDDSNPSVVYTFTTTAVVAGTPTGALSSNGSTTSGSSTGKTSTTGNALGTGSGTTAVAYRGTLSGAVNAAGKLSLAFKGKGVTSLTAGRYTLTVVDASAKSGFTLQGTNHAAIAVSGVAFRGTRRSRSTSTYRAVVLLPDLRRQEDLLHRRQLMSARPRSRGARFSRASGALVAGLRAHCRPAGPRPRHRPRRARSPRPGRPRATRSTRSSRFTPTTPRRS